MDENVWKAKVLASLLREPFDFYARGEIVRLEIEIMQMPRK